MPWERPSSCACGSASAGPSGGDRQPVADGLLRPFPADVDVADLVSRWADCTRVVVRDGVDEAMCRSNGAGPCSSDAPKGSDPFWCMIA